MDILLFWDEVTNVICKIMLVEEHSSAGIDVTEAKDGGVIKVIKKEGCGNETPSEGATVYVHYVGTLLNGEKFDSSKDAGRPFDFVLGRGK